MKPDGLVDSFINEYQDFWVPCPWERERITWSTKASSERKRSSHFHIW